MKRWHEDLNIAQKNKKRHDMNRQRAFGLGWFDENKPLGRFRKTDGCDCGISGCRVCHSDKFPKRQLTDDEIKANVKFKEQLKELD